MRKSIRHRPFEMRSCGVKSRILSMLLLCGMLLCCAQTALAWSYHSFAFGYSISLPDDWAQVAEEVMAADFSMLPTATGSRGQRDVAFHPKRGTGLDYPFILVEVQKYAQMGFPQQLNDSEIQQVVKNSTGIDPSSPFSNDAQVMQGGAEPEPLDAVLDFDAPGRCFTWSAADTAAKVGMVRTRQWGFFGKDVLVRVTLFERGKGSDRLRDMARAVAGSLKFEVGREYQPVFTPYDAVNMAGQMISAPNMGVMVTGACVLVALCFAAIALSTNRRPQSSYQPYSDFEFDRDL